MIKEKLRAQGYNASKSKEYLVYRNVKLNDLDNENAQDILFSIERKSRKEKDKKAPGGLQILSFRLAVFLLLIASEVELIYRKPTCSFSPGR